MLPSLDAYKTKRHFILPETTALQFAATKVTVLVRVMANSTLAIPMYFLCMISPSQLWNLFGLQMCIICLNYVLGLTFSICSPLFLRGGRRGLMGLYHCRRFSFWSLGELQNFRFLFLHSANIHVGRACCIFPILLAYSSCINIMWKFCYWMPKWHSILDEFSKKIGG